MVDPAVVAAAPAAAAAGAAAFAGRPRRMGEMESARLGTGGEEATGPDERIDEYADDEGGGWDALDRAGNAETWLAYFCGKGQEKEPRPFEPQGRGTGGGSTHILELDRRST